VPANCPWNGWRLRVYVIAISPNCRMCKCGRWSVGEILTPFIVQLVIWRCSMGDVDVRWSTTAFPRTISAAQLFTTRSSTRQAGICRWENVCLYKVPHKLLPFCDVPNMQIHSWSILTLRIKKLKSGLKYFSIPRRTPKCFTPRRYA
jgi:hypothetical protein